LGFAENVLTTASHSNSEKNIILCTLSSNTCYFLG